MRTTVTLDPDVVEQLREAARQQKKSFKATLNETLRAGLAAGRGGRRPYRLVPRKMHLREGVDLTHALRLADSLEDQEVLRKLELRK